AGGAALGLFALAALREVRALAGPHAAGWTAPIALFGIGAAIGASFLAERRRRVPPAAAAALASLLLLVLVIAGGAGTAAMLLFLLSVFAAGAWVGARAGEEERGRSAEGARDAGASLPSALLGASAAFFAGSRLIVPAFGAAGVSLAAALLFAILAAVAIGEGRRRTADAGHEADAGNGGNAGSAGSPAGPVSIAVFVLALAALATGWGRLLDLLIGPTLRASGLYWTVLLFGGFVGAAAAGRAARSGRAGGYATLFLALHALLVLLSSAVAGELPYFFLSRIKGSVGDPGVLFRARLLIVALLVFPASVAAGAALRTLLAGGAPARSRTRPFAAAASAIALAGGAILAPRLLPAIGIRGAMLAGAALSVLVALRRVAGSGWPLRARLASFLPLVVLLAIAAASPPRWKPGLLNTAVYRYAGLHERIDKEGFLRTYAIVPAFYEEGSRTTVMVAGAGGSRLLAANGSVEMSDKEHLAVQVLLGRLPLLFRPGLERVFVAGSGAGITAGTLLAGGTAEVVTVEPEPARLEAMRHFARANREPWKDGRARFEIGEPRARLARSGESFDAIVCQPSAPWDRDAAHRATAEFFRTAASRLRPGGVLATSFPV
ncbi:MAG: methyltransferase domain-containing protein, partial [Candidatus Latescibacterota bacterium]